MPRRSAPKPSGPSTTSESFVGGVSVGSDSVGAAGGVIPDGGARPGNGAPGSGPPDSDGPGDGGLGGAGDADAVGAGEATFGVGRGVAVPVQCPEHAATAPVIATATTTAATRFTVIADTTEPPIEPAVARRSGNGADGIGGRRTRLRLGGPPCMPKPGSQVAGKPILVGEYLK